MLVFLVGVVCFGDLCARGARSDGKVSATLLTEGDSSEVRCFGSLVVQRFDPDHPDLFGCVLFEGTCLFFFGRGDNGNQKESHFGDTLKNKTRPCTTAHTWGALSLLTPRLGAPVGVHPLPFGVLSFPNLTPGACA